MRTPAWNPNHPEVPFDVHGNLMHYAGYGAVWRLGDEFKAVLSIDSMERGRSAAFFWMLDSATGRKYCMFMADMFEVMKNYSLVHGNTPNLTWTYSKRGQNYGIKVKK